MNKTLDGNLTTRTLHGVFWTATGKGAEALLKIGVLILLARLLGPYEFGVVGAALIVVGFSQIASTLGTGPALVQRPDLTDLHLRAGHTLSVLLGVVIGLIVFFSAPSIALFFRIPELYEVVRALSFIFPISALSLASEAMLMRRMRYKNLAAIEFVSYAIGYGATGVILALLGFGVWALVYAQIGQAAVKTVILLLLYPHGKLFRLAFRSEQLGHLLKFGMGYALGQIANTIALQADNIVVSRLMGAEALGAYGRAYQFMMAPTQLIGTVSDRALFPAMSSIQLERERLGRSYLRTVGAIALLTLPGGALLAVIAPELIVLLVGASWTGVVLPFQILALVLFFRTSYKISDSVARATGAVYRRAWRQWAYAGAVFLGAWAGHFWGLGGVAAGTAAAIIFNFCLMHDLSVKLLNMRFAALWHIIVRHFLIAVTVGAPAFVVAELCRRSRQPDLVVVIAALAVGCSSFTLIALIGRSLLGREGEWLWSLVTSIVKKQARPAPSSG